MMNSPRPQQVYSQFNEYLTRMNKLRNNGSLLLHDLQRLHEEDFIGTYRALTSPQRKELTALLNGSDAAGMTQIYELLTSTAPDLIEVEARA